MKKGFTLIELMIVIAIIATLSAVILTNISEARKKGKVAQAMTDLAQLKLALSNYYGVHGSYPVLNSAQGDLTGASGCLDASDSQWIPGLAPRYIPVLPQSPGYVSDDSCANDSGYGYSSDGSGYELVLVSTLCNDVVAKNAGMLFRASDASNPGICGYWTEGWGPTPADPTTPPIGKRPGQGGAVQ